MTVTHIQPSNWDEGESFKTGSDATKQRKEQYLEWLLTPESERDPKTKGEVAEQLGVSTQTLRNYANDRKFQKDLAARQGNLNKVERATDVLDSLYQRATGGAETDGAANAAAKIWLDYIAKTTDLEPEGQDVGAMSNEDLGVLMGKLLKRISEPS